MVKLALPYQNDPVGRLCREWEMRCDRKVLEDSLVAFMREAWPHMGEPNELDLSWHHRVIAAELEAQAAGAVPTVVINQPPRTTKTLMCSVALPAWIWAQPEERWSWLMGPHVQFFCLSYGATLAEEIAVKHRRLVLSPWYQERWGHQVQIRDDQASRANFATTRGGGRLSNSIEGGILGRGGIWQIIDDPHHTKGAESDTQRQETLEGMRSLVTRVNNPRHAARTLVMQRLHTDDATNYALENWGRVKHLMFPMRFVTARAVSEDPRQHEGELLWPSVWDEHAVEAEAHELGPYGAEGQLQQAPVPRGGGIIQRDWWRVWPDDAEREGGVTGEYKCYLCGWETQAPVECGLQIECQACGRMAERRINFPPTSFRMLSVDTAYSEEDQKRNSWNAITRWGVWHNRTEAPCAMLMQSWRGRPPLRGGSAQEFGTGKPVKGLVEIVDEMAVQGQVDVVLIEKKTRGVDLFHELERLLARPSRPWKYRLEYFEPTGRGDKVARLTATQALFTTERVWAPAKKWADTVIDEVANQPRAAFADLCDTVSSALIWMRASGYLKLEYEHQEETRRALVFRGNRRSVVADYEEA